MAASSSANLRLSGSARTHDLAWEFKRCGIVCTVAADLGLERWRKLVWNIPFNGLADCRRRNRYRADFGGRAACALRALALMDETIAGRERLRSCTADRGRARADQAHRKDGRLPAIHLDRLSSRPAAWRSKRSGASRCGARTPRARRLPRTRKRSIAQLMRSIASDAECEASSRLPRITVRIASARSRVDRDALQTFAVARCRVCVRKAGNGLTNISRSQHRARLRSAHR